MRSYKIFFPAKRVRPLCGMVLHYMHLLLRTANSTSQCCKVWKAQPNPAFRSIAHMQSLSRFVIQSGFVLEALWICPPKWPHSVQEFQAVQQQHRYTPSSWHVLECPFPVGMPFGGSRMVWNQCRTPTRGQLYRTLAVCTILYDDEILAHVLCRYCDAQWPGGWKQFANLILLLEP